MKTVTVKYELGHSIDFNYKKDETVHCLSCGKKEVWAEQSEGDYYAGPNYVCTHCNATFTFQGPGKDEQVAAQLRSDDH